MANGSYRAAAGTISPAADHVAIEVKEASGSSEIRLRFAGGRDAGAAKLAAPLASPADFFELTFAADAPSTWKTARAAGCQGGGGTTRAGHSAGLPGTAAALRL